MRSEYRHSGNGKRIMCGSRSVKWSSNSPRSPVAERSAVCALGAFASREHGPSVTFLSTVRHIRTDPLEASVVACQWLQESGLWQSLRETTALARFHIDVYLLHL